MISGKPPEAAFASAPAIQCHTSQDGNHRLPVPDERVQTNGREEILATKKCYPSKLGTAFASLWP